jgi:aminoglycoside 2'-N-acetyltransferase I
VGAGVEVGRGTAPVPDGTWRPEIRQARDVPDVTVAHTADLSATTLDGVRTLLWDAFDDMTEEDFEHGLGGMHAFVLEGGAVIAHASVVQRRLLYGGRALRCGYVEAVAVRADRRRLGLGSAVMAPLERIIRGAYDLGALGATDEAVPLYEAHGWQLWEGPSYAITPAGLERTADHDGAIYVLEAAVPLNVTGRLTCDWRDGEVW